MTLDEYITSKIGNYPFSIKYTSSRPCLYICNDSEEVRHLEFHLTSCCGINTNKWEVDQLLDNMDNNVKISTIIKVDVY